MLSNHYIELLHSLTSNFLVDFNDSIDMIASYSNFVENKFKK